jgi:hypothetical protein
MEYFYERWCFDMMKRFVSALCSPGALSLVLMCQLTDVGFYGIKAGELLALLMLPFIMLQPGNIKKSGGIIFLFLFLFLLLSTLVKNPFVDFFQPALVDNLLKEPYVISLVRFFELILCGIALSYTYFLCRDGERAKDMLHCFLTQNALFGAFFLLCFIASFAGIDTGMTYGEKHRLKGFFVEGGPLGAYYAALFCLDIIANKKLTKSSIIFLMVILAAQSKAAIFLLVFYFVIYGLLSQRRLSAKLLPIFFSLSIAVVGYTFYGNHIMGYVNNIVDIEGSLIGRENDPSIVMGRVSGTFIGTNIIVDNPVFGVGLGNYSLVRNNPDYLGVFPAVDLWDLTGLGIYTIPIESGLVGLFAFFIAFWYFYKRLGGATARQISIIPLTCLIFGTQFYFIYLWVIWGFASALSENMIFDKKNQ